MVYPSGKRINHYAFYFLFAYGCQCSLEVQQNQKAYDILAACYIFVEQNRVLKKVEKIALFTNLVSTSAFVGKYGEVIRYGNKLLMLTNIPLEIMNYTLTEMSKAFENLGQQRDAEQIKYLKNLELLKTLGNKESQNCTQAEICGFLGEICRDQGEYKNALENFQNVLRISKIVKQPYYSHTLKGRASSGLGSVYCNIGQYKMAQDWLEKALYISQTVLHDDETTAMNYAHLGNLFRDIGEHDKAIQYGKKGLEISLRLRDTPAIQKAWFNLGTSNKKIGKFKQALNCHEQTLKLLKQLGDLRGEGQLLCNLANVCMRVGEIAKSLDYHKQSLEISKKFCDAEAQMASCVSLGSLYYNLRQHDLQCRFLCQAISISDKLRRNFTEIDPLNISSAKKDFQTHQLLMMGLLHLSYQKKALLALDVGRSKALFDLLRLRSSAFSECLLESQNIQWINEIPRIIDQKKPDGHGHISENVCRSLQGGTIVVFGFDLHDSLLTWIVTEEKTSLRKWTSARFKTPRIFFADLLTTLQKHVKAFQQPNLGLKDRRDESMEKNTKAFYEFPYELQNIDLEVAQTDSLSETEPQDDESANIFRGGNKIVETVARGDLQQVSMQLRPLFLEGYMKLIAPIEDLLTGSRLIIVPAASLFLLPFSALLDRDNNNLCDRYSIQITPALHTLNFSLSMPFLPLGPALCIGNPSVGRVFFQDNDVNISPLPGAEEEAKECAAYFGAKPLLNEQATKKNVLERMKNASVLHIAAHGNMNYGEIFLAPNTGAPSPPKEEHYLLTPKDISKCSLSARLVVLSCCHSGRGEISSEGVAGTARAFLGAGARAVLVSLWALPDRETRAFMKLFYENVCKGLSVCVVLQQAMKIFKESNYGVIAWAPFQIFGEDVVINCEDLAKIGRLSRLQECP